MSGATEKPQKRKGTPGKEKITVELPTELLSDLNHVAGESERSRNAEIVFALRQHVRAFKEANGG